MDEPPAGRCKGRIQVPQLQRTTPPRRMTASGRNVFGRIFVLLLFSFALCLFASSAEAGAQSGRRGPNIAKPGNTPVPASDPAQGESESKPRAQASKKENAPLVSFIVFEDDNLTVNIDRFSREIVTETFMRRLGAAHAVAVTRAGDSTRKDARERAKNEKESYVVLMMLEDEAADSGAGSISRIDPRLIIVRTYVYAPVTGDLKFSDRVSQRPYRPTGTIGGVRVPVPVGRRERYPSEYQLEQLARDAADHLMARFNVVLPPEN